MEEMEELLLDRLCWDWPEPRAGGLGCCWGCEDGEDVEM